MASDPNDSLLSDNRGDVQHVFPVSVHANKGGDDVPTTPEDRDGLLGRGAGYSLRRFRKRSFTEFDDSDQYPYSEEDSAAPAPRRPRSGPVHPLLDFSVLADGRPSRVRVRNWTHPETKSLLAIWGDPEVQTQLKNSVHNNWIWERISVLIGRRHPEFQPSRTAAQCKERLTYLRKQYRKAARLRARGKWPNVGNIQVFLDVLHSVLGKRSSGDVKPTVASTSSTSTPSTSISATATSSDQLPPSSTAQTTAASQQAGPAVPSLPEVPESDYEEDDDDDEEEEEGDLEERGGDEIQDLFGQSHAQDVEIDFSAEMSENNSNKTTEPVYTSFNPTAATNSSSKLPKRPSSFPQQNPKKPRGRPKANAPPRDDLTVAQAITDAVMRFIDHQSFHLTEQTKLLQRYLKFERARMRWEMDMETRRMKWEEEREMREEERRQRQEELQAKRVSDNREFMLQMAVVLGNGAAGTSKDSASTQN